MIKSLIAKDKHATFTGSHGFEKVEAKGSHTPPKSPRAYIATLPHNPTLHLRSAAKCYDGRFREFLAIVSKS